MKELFPKTRLFAAAFQMDYCYNVQLLAVPLLAISLGASAAQMGVLVALQRTLYILVCPFAGRFTDRWGPKRLALTGASWMVLCSIALMSVRDLNTLFLAVPALGLSTALFWTPLQTWLKHSGEERELTRSTSLFNISWSVGALVGTSTAGFLIDWDSKLPFGVTATLGLSILALLLWYRPPLRKEIPKVVSHVHIQQARQERGQMMAAWIAVFFLFFAFGHVVAVFPKLATEMGYTAGAIGLLMTALGLTRTLSFGSFDHLYGRYGSYRLLIGSKIFCVVALLLFFYSEVTGGFVVAFLLLGFGVAMAFSVSQHRSLQHASLSGRRIGINESVVVGGFTIGAAFSGLVAEAHGLRAPYLVTAIMGGCVFLLQPWWMPRWVREKGW